MRERAVRIALDTLALMTDPDTVGAVALASARTHGVVGLWHPLSIATGHAGVALGHLAAAEETDRFRAALRAHLSRAAEARPALASTSVMEGYGSLVAATVQVAAATGDCRGFATRGLSWLARLVAEVAQQGLTSWDQDGWHDERIWDALCGIAGAVRVLIAGAEADLGEHDGAIAAGLRLLVRLCAPACPAGRPAWWIPAGVQRRCPFGGADPGLAHGIGGPLVTLSVAARKGVLVDGQQDSIRYVADWLVAVRQRDLWWPHTVSLDGSPSELGRTAWCYGAGGVARALHLAGQALRDSRLTTAAVEALVGVCADLDACHLSGPTICHGYAGLLHVVTRTLSDTADPRLTAAANAIVRRVLDCHDSGAPFRFRHLQSGTGPDAAHADVPGLLTGAAGVAAALLAWARPTTAPAWDLVLMTG